MTSPDAGGRLRADLDAIGSAGSRWDVMTTDLDPGAAPSPGDLSNPTGMAVLALHGTMHVSSAQLMAMLGAYAQSTSKTAHTFGAMEGMNASQLKDVLSIVTGVAKDVESTVADVGKAATSTLTTMGTAATQAGTTAMTAAMTAATKAGTPGGATGLTAPGNLDSLHHDGTTQGGEHHDRTADADAPARV